MTLTRRYRFSASHRLHSTAFTEEENRLLFGKCNNPFGHGHDYVLSVAVAGPIHRTTGLIVNVKALDALVDANVIRVFAHRNLNQDLPQFEQLVPTTENIAVVIAGILEERWSECFEETPAVSLQAVQLQETDRNSFELDLLSRRSGPVSLKERESVAVDV